MRTEIAIISALTLVLSVPLAFGEIVETKGQNYDLVENFFIGEAVWESHPERIMDGGWQNYALSNTGDKVIFNTNAVGSFVFDKDSCSYSIYGNGFDGEQIIPSVSAVATYLNNGQWQNLPINDEACTVKVDRYEDGVFLTSTKVITEDITEDVFIDYTGTTEAFYANSTNSQFTLISNSTGNVGYFNGETRVVESVEIEKFVQEIRLDINSGFKETFKVWHDGDEQLGISQTVHTGENITIGDQTINIAELNGQSFDRQFIIDNEAEILQIANNLNYDFDTGIDSLSNINIIFDGDYKVNMDFSEGNFVGYLEIDPTFTGVVASNRYIEDSDNNDVCDPSGTYIDQTNSAYMTRLRSTPQSEDCAYTGFEFDISSITDGSTVTDSKFKFEINSISNPRSCDFIGMDVRPSTATADQVFRSIHENGMTGTELVASDSVCLTSGTNKVVDLGSAGDTYFTNQLVSDDWAGIGVRYDNMALGNAVRYTGQNNAGTPVPTLELTYTVPIAPQPPTGLTTVTGVPVELDWTAPTDNGGSAITGYKVFRTLNEYAFTELPDNSANSAGIDFTNNEFLTHGLESTTSTSMVDVVWDTNNLSGGTASGSTFTGSVNGWSDGIARSVQSISPETGGGEMTCTKSDTYAMCGFSNDPFWTSGDTWKNGDYLLYRDEIYENGSGLGGGAFSSSTGSVFKITMDENGQVDYYVDGTYIDTSSVTASGDYYVLAVPYNSGNFVTAQISQEVTTTSIPDKSTNNISVTRAVSNLDEMNDSSLWTQVGTDVGITNGKLIADFNAGSDHRAIKDVGVLSDQFVSHFDFKAVSAPTAPYWTMFAFTDDTTVPRGTNDGVYALLDMGSWNIYLRSSDGNTDYATQTGSISLSAGNQYYVTYTRDSATSHSMSVYTDEARTSQVGSTITATIGGTVDNLQYFQTGRIDGGNAGSPVQYEIDNLSISDGTTTYTLEYAGTSTTGVIGTGVQNPNLSFTDSNLPDNTDDFSIGSWVKLDEQTDNIVIDWNGQGDNNDHFAKVDLGSALSDTNWVLRFTNEITAISATGGSGGNWIVIGLGDSPSIPATSTGQDFIGVLVRDDGGSANGDDISSMDSDGSTDLIYDGRDTYSTLYASNLSTGTYNTEIIRTSATAYTVNHYNSDWSSVIDTISGTTNSNNDGLRYFTVDTSQDINTGSPAYTGQVTNVQVWDGVTSATGTPESFDSLGTPLGSRVTFGTGNALATEPIGELLKLNDVTFNVGTTSASVVELATAPSYSTDFGTSTGWTVTDSEISVDTANNRIYYNGDLDTTDTSAYYDYYTSQGANLQTWTVDIDITKQSNTNNSHRTEFLITDTLGGVGVAQNAIGITTQANNDMDCRYYAGTTSTTDIGTHSTSNGVTKYVRLSYDGTTFTCDLMDSSRTSVSSSHSATVSGVDMSNARYIIISDRDNTNSSVNDVVIEFENLAVTPTNTMESSIISATGLTDNTSTPQHYTFTRSNNDWTIYQNGVSEATATDTTSLGANTASGNTGISWDSSNNNGWTIGSNGEITSGTTSGWTDGILSTDSYNPSTGGLYFNVQFDNAERTFIGFNKNPTTNTDEWQNGEFLIYQNTNGILYLYENGSATWDSTTTQYSSAVTSTDVIGLEMTSSGQIKLYKNGVNVFTSSNTASGDYYLYSAHKGVPVTLTAYTTGIISVPYTTHIDGMVDEYFINSDSLTSTEVEMAYEKGSEPTQIDTTGSTTTEYDDSNVTGGTEYYYTVKATNAIGDSNFLTPFVSALAGTPPQSPTSVSSTINNPNTAPLDITVSWSAPTNVGTGTLTGFEIYRDSVLIDTTGLVTSYTDTVPSGGGTFEYKLKAVSTHGTSGFSATTSTTTPTVPPAPTNAPSLAINNPNPSPLDIEVSWTEPSSGGSTIQSYEVFRSATETGTYTSVGTVTDLDFTDTVPSAGTWYYKFTAINLVGSSGLSPFNSITTASVPSSPLNASSVIPSINSAPYDVTVSWDLPTSTGGSALTGYNVYRQTGTGTFSLITTTTALGYVDTVPTALNQDYTYKIHAVNNVGESTAFTTTTITTGNVPDAPTLSFTTGTTALSWTVPNSDASITGYKIFRDSSLLTTVTTTSHSDFTPINFGQSYQYEVKAVSSLGDSASSNSIVTTPETEITGMVVQGITGTGAVIDWEEPAYYQGQITSYSVYYATPATSANPTISAGTTTNTYSNFAPTLDYDTSYTFGVTVNSPLGNSGFSNLVNATTNVDSSIVAYDPNTGGMEWFDIDSVSEQTVNVIEFQRETQNLNVNGTFTDVDTLQVGYPSWWDDMTCNVDYKFAQKTEQYVEGTDMTAVVNSADANQQVIGFQFHDIDNEVIEVECAPQQSTQDDGVSAKYIMTQTDLSTGTPNIPLVTQIQAFQTGDYGTDGEFGALDVVGLFVILISMVGFNRLNPIVGVLLSASLVFGLSFFGIISLPTVLVGIVALVIFLAWGITRNR